MTPKRSSCVLPALALLLLGGAARAQFPSAYRPYDPFGRPPGGSYHGGVPGRPAGPWTGQGPRQPWAPNPVGRPLRQDRDRSAVNPELAGKLAEGVASGLSNSGHSSGTPRTTFRPTSFAPPRAGGTSWWKGAASRGRGWLVGIGAGIAAALGALLGRRKQ